MLRSKLHEMKMHGALYAMMIPVILYFGIFVYYPLVQGAISSFQDFNLIGDRPYTGWDNYTVAWNDPQFWQVVRNTLLVGGGILVVGFFPPIIVAISLHELARKTFKKFSQTVIYLPHLFSWVVVGGIWIYVLSPRGGLVNELLALVEVGPVRFLTNGLWARALMILLPIWKEMGFAAIIYLAAITTISPSLYEAARIDGATRFQQIHQITIPLLAPTMKVVLMLNVLGLLRIFDQIYVLRNGVVQRQVDVIMTYVYDTGILKFEVGVASAISMMVLLATLGLTAIVWLVTGFGKET